MVDALRDMTLVVKVTVSGTVGSGSLSVSYDVALCAPPSTGVLTPATGDIDLTKMAYKPGLGFNEKTNIYFVLNSTVTGQNGPIPLFFPSSVKNAVTITPPPGGASNITASLPGNGGIILMLDILVNDDQKYLYALNPAMQITSDGPTVVTLDPAIINRGSSLIESDCPQ